MHCRKNVSRESALSAPVGDADTKVIFRRFVASPVISGVAAACQHNVSSPSLSISASRGLISAALSWKMPPRTRRGHGVSGCHLGASSAQHSGNKRPLFRSNFSRESSQFPLQNAHRLRLRPQEWNEPDGRNTFLYIVSNCL